MAWAAGGYVLKTVDGGATWARQDVPIGFASGVFAVSPSVAWAVSHGLCAGAVAKTVDGATWDQMSPMCGPLIDIAAAGTPVEGAALDIRLIEGKAHCEDCDTDFLTDTLFARCPCGSRHVRKLQGEELNIKTVELEEGT